MHPDSIPLHAAPPSPTGGLAPPLDRSIVWETPAEGPPFRYGRSTAPVAAEAEAVLGALEDAEALVFAAGMSAISCLALATLRSGDAMAVPDVGYYELQLVLREVLGPFGVEARLYDPRDPASLARRLPGRARRGGRDAGEPAPRPSSTSAPPPSSRTRRARCWSATTPSPPRSTSGRSSSAPTSAGRAPRSCSAGITTCSAGC